MSDPAENVVQHAEDIAAAEQQRIVTQLFETRHEAYRTAMIGISEIVTKMTELMPKLQEFASLVSEAEKWEDEQLAQLEDDFWQGREQTT